MLGGHVPSVPRQLREIQGVDAGPRQAGLLAGHTILSCVHALKVAVRTQLLRKI